MDNEREILFEGRFEAHPGSLGQVRGVVAEAARRAGLVPAVADDIALAVNEAFANVIRHAYCHAPGESVALTVVREPARLVFLLKDDAPCIDPARVAPRDLGDLRPGGLGVHFIREIMNEMRFHDCTGRGNTLEMIKNI